MMSFENHQTHSRSSSARTSHDHESAPGLESPLRICELIREDYLVHGSRWHSPGFQTMATYRMGVWRMTIRRRVIRVLFSGLYKLLYRRCTYVYGIEIPYTAKIGRRLRIEHQHGIVVHGAAVIGDDCVLRHGVTLGIRDERFDDEAPRLGNRVNVGAGAKIIGLVQIGDDAKVGANAVVTKHVPRGATVVGIPARVVSQQPPVSLVAKEVEVAS